MPGADDQNTNSEPNDNSTEGTGSNQERTNTDEGSRSSFKSLEEAEAEIKKLRKENADRRTKGKSLEDELGSIKGTLSKMKELLGIEEEQDPETVIQGITQQKEALEMELALKEMAWENGISKEDEAYFRFLLGSRFETLEEDQELTEEDLAEVIAEVRARSAKNGASSTGVNDSSGNKDPNARAAEATVEQFAKMSSSEKQALYTKNQSLYERLFREAQEKRLF